MENRTARTLAAAVTTLSCIGLLVGNARADDPLFTGQAVGARALAMGNSFVALADDFTAVFWNPAGLAFVPAREVSIGLEAIRNESETRFGTIASDASNQRLLINHAGLLRAVPTALGGFAFALGYSSPQRMDNVYRFQGTDTLKQNYRLGYYYDFLDAEGNPILDTLYPGQTLYYATSDVRGNGSLGMLNMAVGWQIAPSLGFGVTLSPILGREYQAVTVNTYKQGGLLFQNSLEVFRRRYRGIDLRMGLLYAPAGIVRAGLRINAPQYLRMYQTYTIEDRSYGITLERSDDEATVITSMSGAVGAAVNLPFMVLSAQSDFRSPFPEAAEGSALAYWRAGVSGGIEVPVPRLPLVVRCGYSWHEPDLYPYRLEWDNAGSWSPTFEGGIVSVDYTTDVHTFTGGVAMLARENISLDVAYAYSTWNYSVLNADWQNAVEEDHASHRLMVSFSFRY